MLGPKGLILLPKIIGLEIFMQFGYKIGHKRGGLNRVSSVNANSSFVVVCQTPVLQELFGNVHQLPTQSLVSVSFSTFYLLF